MGKKKNMETLLLQILTIAFFPVSTNNDNNMNNNKSMFSTEGFGVPSAASYDTRTSSRPCWCEKSTSICRTASSALSYIAQGKKKREQ